MLVNWRKDVNQKTRQFSLSKQKRVFQIWREHCQGLASVIHNAHMTSKIPIKDLLSVLNEHDAREVNKIIRETRNERSCNKNYQ